MTYENTVSRALLKKMIFLINCKLSIKYIRLLLEFFWEHLKINYTEIISNLPVFCQIFQTAFDELHTNHFVSVKAKKVA